nr:TATA binding protein of transcription factor IID [Cryptomonas curvata]|mmetsp:Transcript_36295/g.75872  ORF Transcript_36295/g.75872 Transcript_36295/m.75872 type:complete len:350 (-) Transcript_36295:1666-2715(-)
MQKNEVTEEYCRTDQLAQLIDKCNECGSEDIVEDRRQGDMICKNCGLVLLAHMIDFTTEWRNFSEDQRGNDPNRVGSPLHPLIESNTSTIVSKGLKGSNFLNERLVKTQNQSCVQKSDRFLMQTFSKNILITEKAFLSKNIREKVEELFKLYFNHLTMRSDGSRIRSSLRKGETISILAAALFICCRNEGIPRTFKEISEITKIPKKEIGTRVRAIEMSLRGVKISKTRNTEDFISRFCSKLGLPYITSKLAENLAKFVREKEGLYGKTYTSLAAAAIYIVSQLPFSQLKCSSKEVADAAGISEITLKLTYKAIYPYRNEIIKYLTGSDNLLEFNEAQQIQVYRQIEMK